MRKTILCDMDCILVDMLPPWINRYNEEKGTNITIDEIKQYDVGVVCADQKVLYKIIDEPGFFFDMEPMPGAQTYFQKLLDEGYDVMVVTQPSKRADLAVRDKRRWMAKYFPTFDLTNMIFCHRKELVSGAILFDDKPAHLINWKEYNPKGLTATLDWTFNRHIKTDFRGDLNEGWEQFYQWVKKTL